MKVLWKIITCLFCYGIYVSLVTGYSHNTFLAASETCHSSQVYDMLKSISYDIYLGQDLNLGKDLGQNLHRPNISSIHDVNETCLLDVTKQFLHKYPNEANTIYIPINLLYKNKIIYQ